MIERISANPTIKTHFLPVAQVQKEGKLLRAVKEQAFWSDETVARLLYATGRLKAALHGCKLDYSDLDASSIPTDPLIRRYADYARANRLSEAKTQLELLGDGIRFAGGR